MKSYWVGITAILAVAFTLALATGSAYAQTATDSAITANNVTKLTFQDFERQLLLQANQPNSGVDPAELQTYLDQLRSGFADAQSGSTAQATLNNLDADLMQYSPTDPSALGLSTSTEIEEFIVSIVNNSLSQPTLTPFITTFAPDSITGNGGISNTISGTTFSTVTGNPIGSSPDVNIPLSTGGTGATFTSARF